MIQFIKVLGMFVAVLAITFIIFYATLVICWLIISSGGYLTI
jgi:hypothetical protein